MDNRELLRKSIETVIEETDFPFDDSTRILEEIGLDSTSAMEVLMTLEDLSDLVIDPDTLDIKDFETVQSFVRYLDKSIGTDMNAGTDQ